MIILLDDGALAHGHRTCRARTARAWEGIVGWLTSTADRSARACGAIEARLDGPQAASDRDAIKADIIALFKEVEQEIAQLTALQRGCEASGGKWKQVSGGPAAKATTSRQFGGERPVDHADHIGASTFIEKGWSLISLGDHDGAEQALHKALELSPGDPQAESLLGWAQMLQEKYDDALLNFQKVLMREPANSLARINVGYICLKKRIFGEAIEHLSKAIRLDNDQKATLYAHFYLGLVYARARDVRGRADLLPEDARARAQPDRGVLRAGPRALVRRTSATTRSRRGAKDSPPTSSIRGASGAARC